MRALSAREWAGLAVSTSIARKRRGWSPRISSGITLQGSIPPMMREPVTGLVRAPAFAALAADGEGLDRGGHVGRARASRSSR